MEISGKFENDELPNYGTVIKYDDYEYKGEMKNRDGRFNGKGVLKSLNPKFTYEGEFENGELEGYGILTQDSGVYEGNFKKGLKHGKGTIMAGFLRTGEKKGEKFFVDESNTLSNIFILLFYMFILYNLIIYFIIQTR